MSFKALNSPPLVAAAGASIVLGLPAMEAFAASSASLAMLKGSNVIAFLTNATSVSVPGRIDEENDQAMRKGELNPAKPSGQDDTKKDEPIIYSKARTRSLVNPSGWAFAIWGPIYLGEAVFVASSALAAEGSALAGALPQVTAPFVAANLMQSLWCASFRPSYSEGWHKYISVGMLAGTALSLSHVQAIGAAVPELGWYFLPMSLHFGWTTAATLVNLNGSVCMESGTPDSTVIAVGHASALTAAALGVGITLSQGVPAYGLTVAWALAACADRMGKKLASSEKFQSDVLTKGASVQRMLCWSASAACIGSAIWTGLA